MVNIKVFEPTDKSIKAFPTSKKIHRKRSIAGKLMNLLSIDINYKLSQQFESFFVYLHFVFADRDKSSLIYYKDVSALLFTFEIIAWLDLTWLDLTLIPLKQLTKTQVIPGWTGSQDFSWGGQLDQRTH